MKLLLDENVPQLLVDHLKSLHVDLRTVWQLGLAQSPDSEVVRLANGMKRTIVTRDLGLLPALPSATKYGLILIRFKGPVTHTLLAVLTDFISTWQKKSLKDILVVLDEEKYEIFKEKSSSNLS